ncbi:hypothetical protein JNUCC1_03249 [Lentibacillus sp. JNUCC-1]|nr:hypothetical protein [Lentibacillus sp. JNUCC-1]
MFQILDTKKAHAPIARDEAVVRGTTLVDTDIVSSFD